MASTQYIITARMASDQLAGDLNKVERQVLASVTRIGGALRDIGTTAGGFAGALLGLQALGGAFEAAKAGIIDFNSTMDAAQRSFTFLMGSADEARKHIAELSAVAENTPFRSEDFLAASRVLQGLGANAAAIPDVLKKIANAAVVAQVPLRDAAESIGRFLSGVSATGGANVTQGVRQLASQGLISDKLRASLTAMSETGATSQQIIEKFISSLSAFDGAAEKAAGSFSGLMTKIREQAQETAGTAFEPFFRVFEQLGKSFLAAMKDPEMQKSVQGVADILFLAVKQIAIGIAALIDDVNTAVAAAKSVIEFLQPKIDALQKAGWIFNKAQMDAESAAIGGRTPPSGAFDIPLKTDTQDKTKALFDVADAGAKAAAAVREFNKAAAEFHGTSTGPPKPLFPDAKATQDQVRAFEEAQRIVLGLSLQFTSSEKAGLELQQRFVALAKTAGPLAAKVLELSAAAVNLTEAKAGLDTLNAASEAFRQSLPVYDQTEKALDDVRAKFEALARSGPARVKEEVLAMLPALLKAIEDFQIFSRNMGISVAAAETFVNIGENVVAVFKPIADAIDAFRKSVVQATIDERALQVATAALSATPGQAKLAFGQGQESSLQAQIQMQAGFLAMFEETKKKGLLTEDQLKSLNATIDDVTKRLDVLTGKLRAQQAINPFLQLTVSLDLISKQAQAFGGSFDAIGARIAATEKAINDLIAQGVALDDARVRGLIAALEQLRIQQKIIIATGAIIESSLTTVSDTLIDAFANGTTAAIKWGDVVKSILTDIAKELFRVFVIQTLVTAARGALGGLGGGGGVGGLMAGGIVTQPGIFALAEGGRPEAVIPLDRLNSLGGRGGGDVTINIHPPAETQSSTQEKTDGKGNKTIDIFITQVVKKGLSNGTFDRDMASNFGTTRQGARR